MTDQVVYTSKSRIERVKGPLRRAYLPKVQSPVMFGVHSEVAEHYGVDSDVHAPQATTLDYLVAAAASLLFLSRPSTSRRASTVSAAVRYSLLRPPR